MAKNRGMKGGKIDATPGSWHKLLQYPFFKYGLIDYRTVLPNEICIEMDFIKWKNQRFWGNRIRKYLEENRIPHLMYCSGGKGIHFSIFYNADGLERVVGWRAVRYRLWHYILNWCDVPMSYRGTQKPFDITSVSFSDLSKGHLIREVGGRKKQRKRIIKRISKTNEILTGDVVFPKRIPVWNVPVEILKILKVDAFPWLGDCNKCRALVPSEFMPIFIDKWEEYPVWVGCYHCKYKRRGTGKFK